MCNSTARLNLDNSLLQTFCESCHNTLVAIDPLLLNRVQQSAIVITKIEGSLSWTVSFFIMIDLDFDTGAIVAYIVLAVLLMIISAAVFGSENTLFRLVKRIQVYSLSRLDGYTEAEPDEIILFSKVRDADISMVNFRPDDL